MGGWRSKEDLVSRKWVYLFVCSYYYEEFWGNLIFWILIVTLGSFLHPSSVLRMGVGFSQCVRVLSVFTLDLGAGAGRGATNTGTLEVIDT